MIGLNKNTIKDCYSTSAITSASAEYSHFGGFAGYNKGIIENSCAIGDITVSDSDLSKAGGFAGEDLYGIIKNCYATGAINAGGKVYAGGFLGEAGDSAISNCYATGNVSAHCSGGFIGVGSDATINNCYAVGNLTCKQSSVYAGGFIADSMDNNVNNSYRSSSQTISNAPGFVNYDDGASKGLDTLKTVDFQKTTLGWSDSIWTFTEGQHPVLKNINIIK